MRDSGRLSAVIENLEDFERRRVPLKTCLQDWARGARYAGAKDRAWISGLCLDVLRKRNSLGAAMGDDGPRALALASLRFLWGVEADELAFIAAEEPHGPGALTDEERVVLASNPSAYLSPSGRGRVFAENPGEGEKAFPKTFAASSPSSGPSGPLLPDGEKGGRARVWIAGDFPEWLTPQISRVFGDDAPRIMSTFATRADIDLRINTLKANPEKALAALKNVNAEPISVLTAAARIPAPDAMTRAPSVTVIPAFNKGWVEVQDVGSQIAAAAAGAIKGAQVLDYCAGGGGKTLALAALMENTGQLYAFDRDAARLKPLYARARRAGARNLQIINPTTDKNALDVLEGKMDVVFVDAPCTGAGAWRRHPDTKWRLTPQQLERRLSEQDAVLAEAAAFVKPGGRIVWATCSFLMEENEDRLAVFLKSHADFALTPALDAVAESGLLTGAGRAALEACVTTDGALRLTPDKIGADGFYIATLIKR